MKRISAFSALVLLLSMATGPLFAYDFGGADFNFARREKGDRFIGSARKLYKDALKSNLTNRETIYAVAQLGKLAYYEGEIRTAEGDAAKRLGIFGDCIKFVEKAKPSKVGESGEYYYWKATCLAFWGKAAGPLRAVGKVRELKKTFLKGLEIDEGYLQGGIHRIAAGIYIRSKMLRLFGLYDPQKALYHANQAIEIGPDFYNSYVLKAEIMMDIDKSGNRQEVMEMLDEKIDELEDKLDNNDSLNGYRPEMKVILKRMKRLLGSL